MGKGVIFSTYSKEFSIRKTPILFSELLCMGFTNQGFPLLVLLLQAAPIATTHHNNVELGKS
jgi:hypothetical protein